MSHRSAAAFVDAESRLFLQEQPLGPDDRVMAGLSVSFDASCEEMWLAWAHGACLVPAPRSLVRSGMDLGPWLVANAVTVVRRCPRWCRSGPPRRWTPSGCSSSAVRRVLPRSARAWPPPSGGVNTYGPTEATVVACAARLTGTPPVRIGPARRLEPRGRRSAGLPVEPGEPGELIIGGVGLARYLDPVKDAEKYAAMPTPGRTGPTAAATCPRGRRGPAVHRSRRRPGQDRRTTDRARRDRQHAARCARGDRRRRPCGARARQQVARRVRGRRRHLRPGRGEDGQGAQLPDSLVPSAGPGRGPPDKDVRQDRPRRAALALSPETPGSPSRWQARPAGSRTCGVTSSGRRPRRGRLLRPGRWQPDGGPGRGAVAWRGFPR